MIAESTWFDVSGSVGYGQIATDGTLGFSDNYLSTILARRSLDGWSTISAHANSRVLLNLTQPAKLLGFLNLSASYDWPNPTEFWADHNFLGQCYGPGDELDEVVLPAGEHVLECFCRTIECRHAVWAIRPHHAPATPEVDHCDPSNTAVVTVAAYGADDVHRRLAVLARSARRQGIWLNVFGAGDDYQSHIHTKLGRMRDWLGALDAKFVVYLDCRDSFFVRPLADLCEAYRAIGCEIVTGAERACWPIDFDQSWISSFPEANGGRRWINSGFWMGDRAAILRALDAMLEVARWIDADPLPFPGMADVWKYRDNYRDDQFFWQVGFLKKLFPIALDYECRLICNVTNQDVRLEANSDFDFDVSGVTVKSSGRRPCVLHFPGHGGPAMHKWAGRLAAV